MAWIAELILVAHDFGLGEEQADLFETGGCLLQARPDVLFHDDRPSAADRGGGASGVSWESPDPES